MLNKDEMENIEKIKKMLNFTTEGTSLKINNEVSKLLLKYINNLEQTNKILDTECNRLEQKESIIDKVTEECMKQMTTYEDSILEIFPQRILKIIEGEKNIGNKCHVENDLNKISKIMKEREEKAFKLDCLLKKCKQINKEDKQIVIHYENQLRECHDIFYKKSYRRQIDIANARRELTKSIIEYIEGDDNK